MRKGCLYRHRENRDVAIEVLKTFYVEHHKTWKLKVQWWNIGACHEPWPMGIEQKIEVTDDQRRDWVRMLHNERLPAREHKHVLFGVDARKLEGEG